MGARVFVCMGVYVCVGVYTFLLRLLWAISSMRNKNRAELKPTCVCMCVWVHVFVFLWVCVWVGACVYGCVYVSVAIAVGDIEHAKQKQS